MYINVIVDVQIQFQVLFSSNILLDTALASEEGEYFAKRFNRLAKPVSN